MPIKNLLNRFQPVPLYIVLILSICYFSVQLILSHFSHALTLLMASYHMLCNIFALAGSIVTIKVSQSNLIVSTYQLGGYSICRYIRMYVCTYVYVWISPMFVPDLDAKLNCLTLTWLTLKNVVITNWKIKNYVLEYKIWTSFENYRISRGTNVNAKTGSSWTWCRRKIW